MNRTNWKRIAWVTHAVALAVLLGAGIARADVDDAWITSKVKLKLITSQDVHGTPIDVDVDHGVVTLSGRVRSESERSQAEMIARRTDGVRVVHNQLQVVPEYAWRNVQMSDQKLRNNVRKALHNADLRDQRDTRIEVKRVRGGVVTLGGRAGSMDDELRALQVASSVRGVRRVISEIRARDRVAGWDVPYRERNRDRDRDYDNTRYPGDRDRGSGVGDAWITTQIKARYTTDSDVPASTIDVDTRDGNVVLYGTVDSRAAADEAVRIARSVSGVRSVRSELTVSNRYTGSGYDQDHATDAEITQLVRNRIDRAELDAEVQVEVRNGVVYLSGTYDRAEDRYEAVRIARGVSGVTRVQDDLRPSRRY